MRDLLRSHRTSWATPCLVRRRLFDFARPHSMLQQTQLTQKELRARVLHALLAEPSGQLDIGKPRRLIPRLTTDAGTDPCME
jgi:hypothetical protein